MSIKCIIVDDEPLARDVIAKHADRIPSLEVVFSCKNALEAMSFLQYENVDLIFLDIEMPGINGLQMLDSLNYKPFVILTTAYSEYAVESYEYSVTDYLVKPISFERFLKAVNKIRIESKIMEYSQSDDSDGGDTHMFLKYDGGIHKIEISEIDYIKAYGNYLKLFLGAEKIMIYERMNAMETKLPTGFARVHKSFIVNIDRIKKLERNRLYIGDQEIPIGNYYRKVLLDKLKSSFGEI